VGLPFWLMRYIAYVLNWTDGDLKRMILGGTYPRRNRIRFNVFVIVVCLGPNEVGII